MSTKVNDRVKVSVRETTVARKHKVAGSFLPLGLAAGGLFALMALGGSSEPAKAPSPTEEERASGIRMMESLILGPCCDCDYCRSMVNDAAVKLYEASVDPRAARLKVDKKAASPGSSRVYIDGVAQRGGLYAWDMSYNPTTRRVSCPMYPQTRDISRLHFPDAMFAALKDTLIPPEDHGLIVLALVRSLGA